MATLTEDITEKELKVLYPRDDGTEIFTKNKEFEKLAEDYLVYQQLESEAVKEKKKVAIKMKKLIRQHASVLTKKFQVTWETFENAGYTVEPYTYRTLKVKVLVR